MAQDNIFLKEYEILEQSSNDIANRMWQLTGVLIVLALGSGFGGFWIINNPNNDGVNLGIIIFISILAIFLDWTWLVAWYRERLYLDKTQERLRELESILGFRKNSSIHEIDIQRPKRGMPKATFLWIYFRKYIRTHIFIYMLAILITFFWISVPIFYNNAKP